MSALPVDLSNDLQAHIHSGPEKTQDSFELPNTRIPRFRGHDESREYRPGRAIELSKGGDTVIL